VHETHKLFYTCLNKAYIIVVSRQLFHSQFGKRNDMKLDRHAVFRTSGVHPASYQNCGGNW